jgi:hypothetical protein
MPEGAGKDILICLAQGDFVLYTLTPRPENFGVAIAGLLVV